MEFAGIKVQAGIEPSGKARQVTDGTGLFLLFFFSLIVLGCCNHFCAPENWMVAKGTAVGLECARVCVRARVRACCGSEALNLPTGHCRVALCVQ